MRLQPIKILVVVLFSVLAACAPEREPVRHIVAVSTTSTAPPTTVAPSTTTSAPPVVQPPRQRGSRGQPRLDRDALLAKIAGCEGYPNYINSDHPGPSSASGKYGVLDGTWDGYAGYPSAADAPEHVQDRWAKEAMAAAGTRPWNASKGCWSR